MKTLKNLTAAVVVALSVSASAFASDGAAAKKLTVKDAVMTYVDAVSEGNINKVSEVLDEKVSFNSTRGSKVVSHNKAAMLELLKVGENVKQNCETEVRVIASTASERVVRFTMKYDGFSKVEYLNLSNTNGGWKITSVSTSFI